MTNYTTEIELLDQKRGYVHTREHWHVIGEKALAHPEALTDDDITVLGYFGGDRPAAEARARRAQALAPPSEPPAPVTKSAAAPRHPVEFPDRLWKDDAPDVVKAIDEWSVTHAWKALPLFLWWGHVKAGRTKRQALEEKVATLETRLAQLESRPLLKYAGIHVEGQAYQEAQLVTRSGSLWVSTAPTFTTPGTEGSAWRLVVKRGQA